MRLTLITTVLLALGIGLAVSAPTAVAHQDGCHSWHSCPSDSGSYVCGDTGNYSECPALSGSAGYTWITSATIGTSLSASFTWTASPTSVTYQWYRAGTAIAGATASTYVVTADDLGFAIVGTGTAIDGRAQTASASTTAITPKATTKLGIRASAKTVKAGKGVTFRGTLSSLGGVASLPVKVKIWQRVGSSWKLRRTATLTTSSTGTYAVRHMIPRKGVGKWRARALFAGSARQSSALSGFVVVVAA
jgi:hypothetical protein